MAIHITARMTFFLTAPRQHRHHPTVPAMHRIPTVNASNGAKFTIGIAKTVGLEHSMPITILIHKPAVRNTRQNRAAVIAASVIRLAIVRLTAIGMSSCAIVLTVTRLAVPAAAVTRLTQPARPMSVVPAVHAIPLVKYAYRRQRRRRAEAVGVVEVITQERAAAARTQVIALPSLKCGALRTAGVNPLTGAPF